MGKKKGNRARFASKANTARHAGMLRTQKRKDAQARDRTAAADASGKTKPGATKPQPQPQASQQPPAVPFRRTDDVLLVGEGDFSFAKSLWVKHAGKYATLTASCLEPREELLRKYPQAEGNVAVLEKANGGVESGVDNGARSSDESSSVASETASGPAARIVYYTDATRLHKTPGLKNTCYDAIVFNFPHVGGKSTDVNRQVRYNQELLVSFFKSARRLLKAPNHDFGGKIYVTLFEGMPYTLWNIRDLARHSGLVVERSWSFDWSSFEGYKHARTLGNIKSKAEREGDEVGTSALEAFNEEGEPNYGRPGKWRGEERQARCYCFYARPESNVSSKEPGDGKIGRKKRKRDDSSEGEDD